jgi:ABC-type phosphate transport system substrate-binding protein
MIGGQYTSTCRDATISVTGTASFNGLDALNSSGAPGGSDSAGSSGAKNAGGFAAATSSSSGSGAVQIAMSDGPAPAGYPALAGRPVAVIIFAVVVNKHTGVANLTKAQLKAIFTGHYTNWRQVGGNDVPISIIARTSSSGTRRAFESDVLGEPEPAASSYDCVHKNRLVTSAVILCEKNDTPTLLQLVNTIQGAIGYAQISDSEPYPNVGRVQINQASPDIGDVEAGIYPYWTVEYLYTYGRPPAGSLTAAFLSYMNTDAAKNILLNDAYTPCDDPSAAVAALCAKARPLPGCLAVGPWASFLSWCPG